jgi:hypothetical protein
MIIGRLLGIGLARGSILDLLHRALLGLWLCGSHGGEVWLIRRPRRRNKIGTEKRNEAPSVCKEQRVGTRLNYARLLWPPQKSTKLKRSKAGDLLEYIWPFPSPRIMPPPWKRVGMPVDYDHLGTLPGLGALELNGYPWSHCPGDV